MAKSDKTRESAFFPLVEISADSYFELGLQLGKASRGWVSKILKRRKEWVSNLQKFAGAAPSRRFLPFLDALKEHFPQYLEEMNGLAEGAEIEPELIFLLQLNPELNAMMLTAKDEDCSTVMAKSEDKILLGHNEDGSEQNQGLMFLLKARTPAGAEFFTLAYPGIIPGNGPSVNCFGVIHTCNYIGNKQWQEGVPRYFIDRAILEARSLNQAIALASHKARAYSQAHNLASFREKRAVMIESSVSQITVKEINGIVARTNHYIFPEMKAEPEFSSYLKKSKPRLNALAEEMTTIKPEQLNPELLHKALSSHKHSPLSPCRHPNPQLPGATLGMFLFDSSCPRFRVYCGPPCVNNFREFQPAPAR